MSGNVKVCEISDDLKAKLKKFRFRKEKNIAAITMRIEKASLTVVVDDEFEDTTIDDLREELPSHIPSFLVCSYILDHGDGRVSYPLCFVFISPQGTKPELQMMYAGSKLEVVKELGLSKVFELRSTDEFTEEWLKEQLSLHK